MIQLLIGLDSWMWKNNLMVSIVVTINTRFAGVFSENSNEVTIHIGKG